MADGVIDPAETSIPPGDLRPIAPSERAPIMDGLRGFAVLGILAMNIPEFAFPGANFFNPHIGGHQGVDRAVWWFDRVVFDMKMQSIFSMLFGAGLVVLGDRAARAGRELAPLFYRRVGVLAILGLLHAYLLWYGDILWTYAVCGALIYPLRRLSSAWLLTIGLALFVIGAAISSGLGGMLLYMQHQASQAQEALDAGGTPSEFEREMLDAWINMQEDHSPTAKDLALEEAAHRGSFFDVIAFRAPMALELQVQLFLLFSLWRFGGYMLIGIALMRWGVFTGALRDSVYAALMIAGYGIGIPLVVFGGLQAEANGFDFALTFLTCWHLNYPASLCVAMGHIGALTLLFKTPFTAIILPPLAATGRMALTNYLAQSVVCATLFFGWGFDLWCRLTKTQVAGVMLSIWTLQITWSVLWLRRFRLGPAEWLWRRLTYGRNLSRGG